MKKLTNVSPFLLLLFPIFVMLLLGISTQTLNSTKEEILTKKNNTPAAILIKAAKTVLN